LSGYFPKKAYHNSATKSTSRRRNFLRFLCNSLYLPHPAHTQLILLPFPVPRRHAFASSSAVKITSGLDGTKQPMKLKYISTFYRRSPMDLSASWTTTFSINLLSMGAVSSSKLVYCRTRETNLFAFMPSSAWAVMPSFSPAAPLFQRALPRVYQQAVEMLIGYLPSGVPLAFDGAGD